MNKSAVILLFLTSLTQGQLIITEIMSSSAHPTSANNGDWFEVTNTGASAVNVNGIGFADSLTVSERSFFPNFTLAAGASLIVLREDDATAFRQTWQIPNEIRIFARTEFIPEVSGLSSQGETLYLFDSNGSVLNQFEFGPATTGRSFARLQDGGLIPGEVSMDGEFGARESLETPADTASPGTVAEPAPPLSPEFLGTRGVSLITGTELAIHNFSIQVSDPNASDTLTLTAINTPAWLTIGPIVDGAALLSGTPTAADVGETILSLELSDGVAETNNVQANYSIYVHPTSSPIILNEYNAVDADRFLGGIPDAGETASMDSFFGRVLGNGGEWIEFVITGDGGPSLVDASGWTIEIGSVEGGVFTPLSTASLNEAPFWKDLPSGTILTLSTETTNISRTNNLTTQGYASANINYGDSEFMTTAGADFAISPANTAVRILDRNSQTLFGPAGEGIGGLEGIGDTEILELEDDPSPSITALSVEGGGLDGYDPGSSSSTFGAPNLFADSSTSADRPQDFSAFIATPFERWVQSFNLSNPSAQTDTDSDGSSDFEEFLYGGDPTDANSRPVVSFTPENGAISFDIRLGTSPAGQEPVAERSSDLQNWVTTELPMINDLPSPIGSSYRRRTYQFTGTDPRMFFRAFSSPAP